MKKGKEKGSAEESATQKDGKTEGGSICRGVVFGYEKLVESAGVRAC
jgi:hypothetical protein